MAKPLKPEDGETKGHNIAAKNAIINKWATERLKKETEIAKAVELHVAHLKADLSRLDKNVKTDSGITLKVLKANYKLIKLQQDAKEQLDEDAANDILDDMRIAYEALAQGGQFNFVDVMKAADEARTPLKAVK